MCAEGVPSFKPGVGLVMAVQGGQSAVGRLPDDRPRNVGGA
jgi:hypothetical protein